MEEVYKYIVENTVSGKIHEKVAVNMLRMLKKQDRKKSKEIAVIGMAVKMPKADSAEKFWENIKYGIDCVGGIPDERRKDLDRYLLYKGVDLNTIKYAEQGYLEDIDKFDCDFFRISPREASLMDPNQRLFLETAWSALEDAGYGGTKLTGTKTGVYVGFGGESKYRSVIEEVEPSSYSIYIPGNLEPIIASRIAYVMDFKGPSMLVNTACSSSLVAVHYACMDIINELCDMAVAGSVKIHFSSLENNYKLGIESSSGRARTFDDSSDGTGNGEGVAAILLKPLNKALQDRDHIYAVIKGSYINQDGSSNGITAPNPAAQEEVIAGAWKDAGIDPETITYIEAHGTGTKLGDMIEIDGIKKAFANYTNKKQFCGIGSIKTSIGHLDNAAGIAGLVRAILALHHHQLPPTLHFKRPNRNISFENTPIYINDRLRPWETDNGPRRCGISSFGLSGTNCHIVLEEAPAKADNQDNRSKEPFLFVLSAKSDTAMEKIVKEYKDFLENHTEYTIRDICYTTDTGRGHYSHRLAFLTDSLEDLKSKILSLDISACLRGAYDKKSFKRHVVVPAGKTIKEANEIGEDVLEKLGMEASGKIEHYNQSGKSNIAILEEICDLYLRGAKIDWEALYKGMECKKIKLPTYPFERRRCWVDIPEVLPGAKTIEEENLYYTVKWQKTEKGHEDPNFTKGAVIVFEGNGEQSALILNRLLEQGIDIIRVRQGDSFAQAGPSNYTVSCTGEDYKQLWNQVREKGISKILHLMSLTGEEEAASATELKKRQEQGVYSLFHLIRSMDKDDLKENVDLIIVSDYANEVTGREKIIKAENAVLFGLSKIARMEISHMKCKCIDIDSSSDIAFIISEIKCGLKEYKIAYREGIRYSEEIDRFDMALASEKEIGIRPEGVYLITGGTGRIGLNIGKYLASKHRVRIILASRSGLPGKEKWEEILQMGKDKVLCDKIKSVKQIEEMGSLVDIDQADISDVSQLNKLILDLKSRFGKINGIFHCAATGVVMEKYFIKEQTEEEFRSILAPKIEGTWMLDDITRNENLDFIMLFSSAITITGSIGAGAYTAANSYLDSFAVSKNRKCKKIIAVNLFTLDYMVQDENARNSLFGIISTDRLLTELDNIIKRDISRIIIGEINYNSDLIQLIDQLSFKFSSRLYKEVQNRLTGSVKRNSKTGNEERDVVLKGDREGKYTQTQINIAHAWSSVLGLREINIYDSFFDLGGNSILAVRAEVEMEKRNVPADYSHLNTYPTIKGLADFIDGSTPIKDDCQITESLKMHAGEKGGERIQETQAVRQVKGNELCNMEPFNDVYYKSCYANAFFPVVRYYGKSILSFLAFDRIQYKYETNQNSKILDIEYIPFKSPSEIMNGMGLKSESKIRSEDVLYDIQNAILRSRPVIIWVDCFYIPIREDTYRKEHWPHSWLVFGYDAEAGTCSILEHDKKENLTYKKTTVRLQDVVQAYNGYITHYSHKISEPSYYEFFVEEAPGLSQPSPLNTESALLELLGEVMMQNETSIYQGLLKIRLFSEEFANLPLNEEINSKLESIISSLNNIINAKQVDRFRMSEMLGDKCEIVIMLDKILEKWNFVRAKAVKTLVVSSYERRIFSTLGNVMEEIYGYEKEYHDLLFHIFRKLQSKKIMR